MFPVALLASIILFALINLTPGDPVVVQFGEQPTPETRDALRHELGLDQPLPVQFVSWAGRVMRGDFGKSLRNGAPVREEIFARLPATMELGITAVIIGGGIGLMLVLFLSVVASNATGFDLALTAGNILMGLIISATIGIISGYVPALQASRMNPVDAIRAN